MQESIIKNLINLKDFFYHEKQNRSKNMTEETIRSGYINKLLELFNWNLSNSSEVIQEKMLAGLPAKNLKSIKSSHSKPDYQLLDRNVVRMYIDAKNLDYDYMNSKKESFQIRSYGWSSNLSLSIVTNFEYFTVFDTSFKPHKEMNPQYRSFTFTINDLINNFYKYSQFFNKEIVQKGMWNLSYFDLEMNTKTRTLDDDFLDLMNSFRVKLNESLVLENNIQTNRAENYSQIIINRILFIRILEDIGYEPYEGLLNLLYLKESFWNHFRNKMENDYFDKYDGALFGAKFPEKLLIENKYFEDFILSIYGDTPYRFDVIEPSIIAGIYDTFLGKKIISNQNDISLEYKEISPKGSIPTPHEMTMKITRNTIDLDNIVNLDNMYKITVLDPCAGSGAFLVTAFDLLLLKAQDLKSDLEYKDIKKIMTNCLFGVDIDPIAIEVLKMTMSLKLVMTGYKPSEPINKMLSDIDDNFKLGNSILSLGVYDYYSGNYSVQEEVTQLPTNYSSLFPKVMSVGGFDYIVTNPPYVEPKHFKSKYPQTFTYLKKNFISNTGKVDIALYFFERVISLLNDRGKYGLVIQRRFFSTDYGKKIRKWLTEKRYLSEINEYNSNRIFKNRTTYIATIYGQKSGSDDVIYTISNSEVNKLRTNLQEVIEDEDTKILFTNKELNEASTWSYRNLKAIKIFSKLNEGFFKPNESKRFSYTVGPQALHKKFYIFNKKTNDQDVFIGINGENEEIELEAQIVRPIVTNTKFLPFNDYSQMNFRTYLLFPYDSNFKLINIDTMEKKFPMTMRYLYNFKENTTNKLRKNKNEFYGYTRKQNLSLLNRPKVLIPMTSKSVVASFSQQSLFGDNSNINSFVDNRNDVVLLKAYTVIFNSKLFSLLALCNSGDASEGYFKMNKQYIGEVPLPYLDNDFKIKLSNSYDQIVELIYYFNQSYGDQREFMLKRIREINKQSEHLIRNLYKITDSEIYELEKILDSENLDWLKFYSLE